VGLIDHGTEQVMHLEKGVCFSGRSWEAGFVSPAPASPAGAAAPGRVALHKGAAPETNALLVLLLQARISCPTRAMIKAAAILWCFAGECQRLPGFPAWKGMQSMPRARIPAARVGRLVY
jgi:hypothetical protein